MSPIHLLAFPSGGGPLRSHPLPLDGPGSSCTLRLRSLPGSSGIHLALGNGDGLLMRAEVAAQGDEWVDVEVRRDEEDGLRLASGGRPIVYLPADADHEPAPPLRPAYKAKQLDVALVVDGTTGAGGVGAVQDLAAPALLLADRKRWSSHAESLIATAETLAAEMKADLQVAVIAFGDGAMAEAGAPDLRPVYELHPARPEERLLRREDAGQLRSRLLSLPPTSGGDFVDALADALAACCKLRWRHAARRLVLLTGDSPGYSIQQPAPRGADAQARLLDVDVEAAALHRMNRVEILTVYHDSEAEAAPLKGLRPFLAHAREQYRRLATRPDLFFEAAGFDPEEAVRALQKRVPALGRGACPGVLARTRRARRERR